MSSKGPLSETQGEIDWGKVRRVLVVKLRSIGDTVLATPSLIALRRFLPDAQIDILLEDWVAPVLENEPGVNVISVGKDLSSRLSIARRLRRHHYDVAFNLHGGSTATLLTRASGARHRVGMADHRYPALYNHVLSSSSDFWQAEKTHSAEQQLALLGFAGIPVEDRPKTRLTAAPDQVESVRQKLREAGIPGDFVLLHGATSFETKSWPTGNFARTAESLAKMKLPAVAIAGPGEISWLHDLRGQSKVTVTTFSDLSLPACTALASQARLFIGIDSGIAHIAAAVQTPSVVIFGYSDRDHWHPWTNAPHEVVFEPFACQPCSGYRCEVYGEPRCILSVGVERVVEAAERLLSS